MLVAVVGLVTTVSLEPQVRAVLAAVEMVADQTKQEMQELLI
jgi:hypothetical protein